MDYVEKILASPDAFRQIEELNVAMNDEKRRRHEFREWITPNIKAEFINGEIILHSPVKRKHWKITDLFSRILSIYTEIHSLGVVGTEKVMVSLTRNDYEPDLVFFSNEKASNFSDDQMLFPAPDFVVEILSKKTASKDRGIKKQDYAAHGIKEYWIIDPNRQEIEQYILLSLQDETYLPARVFTMDDYIDSFAIKDFSIPVAALFDNVANMEALQVILNSSK